MSSVMGLALVGAGVRVCFTPCHRDPVRLSDREQPPDAAEVVACRHCQRCYTVAFPAVPLDQQQLATWRPVDG
ncbi:MAG: hypothetical protein ACRDZO_14345 [Egibacteraceae bacterium]